MKNILKLMLLALMVLPFQSCSDDDDTTPTAVKLEVTPNNVSGIWQLAEWSGASEVPVVYLELIRKDRIFKEYQSIGSMYTQVKTGKFTLEKDEKKGDIMSGRYDYSYDAESGKWAHDYLVEVYADKMILVADDESAERQVFVRVAEIPADVMDTVLPSDKD